MYRFYGTTKMMEKIVKNIMKNINRFRKRKTYMNQEELLFTINISFEDESYLF